MRFRLVGMDFSKSHWTARKRGLVTEPVVVDGQSSTQYDAPPPAQL